MVARWTVRSLVLVCSLLGSQLGTASAQEPPSEQAPVAAPPTQADAALAEPLPASPDAAAPSPEQVEPVEAAPTAPEAQAAPLAAGPSDAAERAELDARLTALDAYLKDQQPRSRAYFGAWISIMGALTGGQAYQAHAADDAGTRASYIAGSAFSGVGLALVLLSPTPGRYGHKRFAAMPSDALEDKRRKARLGEEFLEGEAKAVRRTKSWFTHVLGATFGVGGFLGLYFGYDDNLENALRTGVGTILVTELRIWTRPLRAIRYLEQYRRDPTTTPPATTFALAPMFERGAQGLVMSGRF